MTRTWKGLGLVAVALALVVLVAACGDDVSTTNSSESTTGTAPQFEGGIAKSAGDPAAAPADTNNATGATTDGGGTSLPSQQDRKVISNTALSLNVDDVGAAFNEAGRLARTNGGYTETSSYTNDGSADAKSRVATLTLRVPATNYDDLLASLRGMTGAKVKSESAKSTEITDQYTDLQSRLRNLERTEQSYLALLQQAKTVQDILTVNDRLDSVRGQIEQIQGRLNVYDNLTDLATVDLTLTPILPAQVESHGSGAKSVSAAFADAWDWSLQRAHYVAAGGAVLAVGMLWLAIPVLIVLGAARIVRRRGQPGAAA
jgi:Domain of unknown function (DUF4349)